MNTKKRKTTKNKTRTYGRAANSQQDRSAPHRTKHTGAKCTSGASYAARSAGSAYTFCSTRPAPKKRCSTQKRRLVAVCIILLSFLLLFVLLFSPVKRRIYPLRYSEEVLSFAALYELDPRLVFAVIKVESDFTPDAVSHAGAQGLMQLMPDTADWVAWRQGKTYDPSRIFEPAYNIDMGCYLLSYLRKCYDGNIDYAVAAYNAGKAAVDSWLVDSRYFDGSELTIPYEETEQYVKKVNFAYKTYKELYDEELSDKTCLYPAFTIPGTDTKV